MIKINLLPPELRKKKKVPFIDRTFVYGVLVLIAEVILLYLISLSQQAKIAELESEIASVQLELDKYQEKLKLLHEAQSLRKELTARMDAVQELENKRAYWVKVLSDFVATVPPYLWIDKFEEKSEGVVEISGKSYTLKSIASFLINLIASDAFSNIKLGPISKQSIGKGEGYGFTLTMRLVGKPKERLGQFVVDTTKTVEQKLKKGYKGFVESTREKLGLYGKEEAKRMFQGLTQ